MEIRITVLAVITVLSLLSGCAQFQDAATQVGKDYVTCPLCYGLAK